MLQTWLLRLEPRGGVERRFCRAGGNLSLPHRDNAAMDGRRRHVTLRRAARIGEEAVSMPPQVSNLTPHKPARDAFRGALVALTASLGRIFLIPGGSERPAPDRKSTMEIISQAAIYLKI